MLDSLTRFVRVIRLKKQYYRISCMNSAEAKESLRRQLLVLKNKKPGYPEDWYLEKIIRDLCRDRR